MIRELIAQCYMHVLPDLYALMADMIHAVCARQDSDPLEHWA